MPDYRILKRILMTIVIVLLVGTIVYDQIKLHRKPVQYQMDIQTADFEFNNINGVFS